MLRIIAPSNPHERRVKEMMLAFGQDGPSHPGIPSEKIRKLRVALLLEEVLEFAKASGIHVGHKGRNGERLKMENLILGPDPNHDPDLVEMADGLADISVVNTGAFIACGITMDPVLECVDANNLMKVATGTENPVTGKFEKHPDHPKPPIDAVLKLQGAKS
jgi:predicted HAD superfamily Cof-like phosphohydrolase